MGAELFLFGFGQTVAQLSKCERTPNAGKLDRISPCAPMLAGLCPAVEGLAEFLSCFALFDARAHPLRRELLVNGRRRQVDRLSEAPASPVLARHCRSSRSATVTLFSAVASVVRLAKFNAPAQRQRSSARGVNESTSTPTERSHAWTRSRSRGLSGSLRLQRSDRFSTSSASDGARSARCAPRRWLLRRRCRSAATDAQATTGALRLPRSVRSRDSGIGTWWRT